MSANNKYKIGIRLENKSQESRVPLIPYDIHDLINHEHKGKLEIVVEKTRPQLIIKEGKYLRPRCFSDMEYQKAGAGIVDNLDDCQVVVGIKEVPVAVFEEGKTYVFFSHTYKGQEYNRAMFLEMIKKNCTLIDYELIVENETEVKFENARKSLNYNLAPASKFKRTVYFGKHAGIVGAMDTLWVLGMKLKEEGYETPFSQLKQANEYRYKGDLAVSFANHKEGIKDYEIAKVQLRAIGEKIKNQGFSENCPPIIVGITGKSRNPKKGLGNTGVGAKEVIDLLDPIEITPKELLEKTDFANNAVYVVYFTRTHTKEIEFQKYLSKLTVLLNCVKWEKGDERFVSVKNLKHLFAEQPNKILAIGDITCDPGGSVEPCQDVYSDKAYYLYEPEKDDSAAGDWMIDEKREVLFKETCTSNSVKGTGPVIMAVTNLPCELPKEASRTFSYMLRNHVMDIAKVDGREENFDSLDISRPVRRAIILYKGKPTPDYNYLMDKYKIKQA